ncbi:MAG: GNAT family N-acetyltransferase [Lachnospiraceae bacterium]|nr:GNAT family N-acetyltransferase [Lachnospiraceae bacterium]
MVSKVVNISQEKLDGIKRIIGEAFVTNELFHNWGSVSERKDDVMEYMSYYVDYVYQSGELYANEDMTGFIGLEDSVKKPIMPQIKMILKMYTKMEHSRIKSLLKFAKQIGNSNKQYAKKRHIDALMVCVDKECQGKGVATELIEFAKSMADAKGLPLLFDTDMKEYSEMYQHFGCELYNSVTADNGVTRYSLCYKKL